MAVPVILDFDASYKVEDASDDLKSGFFTTELQEGGKESLKIEISKNPHELMPAVYNLGFGPMTEDGRINDKAELFRMLQRNYDYLDNYFEIFGLKYYVRMTRFGKR
jgi:hypothetical protein